MLRSASYLLPLLYLPTVLQAQDRDTVDLITPQFSVEVEENVLYGTVARLIWPSLLTSPFAKGGQ